MAFFPNMKKKQKNKPCINHGKSHQLPRDSNVAEKNEWLLYGKQSTTTAALTVYNLSPEIRTTCRNFLH